MGPPGGHRRQSGRLVQRVKDLVARGTGCGLAGQHIHRLDNGDLEGVLCLGQNKIQVVADDLLDGGISRHGHSCRCRAE